MYERIKQCLAITLGSALVGFSMNYFNLANGLSEGGIAGISLLLEYVLRWNTGMMYLLFNIPLLLLGWKALGKRSFLYTVLATVMMSVFLFLFRELRFPMNDLLLASLYAGVLSGIGVGIIFRYGGTSGGTDIVAQILHNYFGWPVGRSLFAFDAATLLLSLVFLDKERMMYTIVTVFVGSRVLDLVLEGVQRGKAVVVISNQAKRISDAVNKEMGRGTTLIDGRGGYTNEERPILYCVVSRVEVMKIKRLIRNVDPYAFVTVSDIFEVLGEGFKASGDGT
ncbi:YitT family protein [Paenibacillus beijingensis]|uniref:YitT family protein n=1 Tax=Paenibacillus beijingensis TaxID=1126833 RepID=UPI000A74F219|nr:YitT family protein [Paenibacillus beijingensis]